MERRFILTDRIKVFAVIEELRKLSVEHETYEVVIQPYKSKRNLDQNAYWWSQIVTPMAQYTGYTPDEMHEILLAEVYGSEERIFRGKTYIVPRRRSSNLNVSEFSELIEHGHRIKAEFGVN